MTDAKHVRRRCARHPCGVNREACLVGVRAYGSRPIAENSNARSRFPAIREELYAPRSFVRTCAVIPRPCLSYRRRDRCPPISCPIHQPFIRPSCPLHFSPVRSMTGDLHPSGLERTYSHPASYPVAGTQRVPGRKACRSRHSTDCMRASRSTSLSADIVHDAKSDRADEPSSIVSNPPRHPRLLSAVHADAGLHRRTSCPGSRRR